MRQKAKEFGKGLKLAAEQSEPGYGYRVLDSGGFRKLEQVGPVRVVRPAPQAVWLPQLGKDEWERSDAIFDRGPNGTGRWHFASSNVRRCFGMKYLGTLFHVEFTDFGHLGIFPEHLPKLSAFAESLKFTGSRPKLLNLFAYTGAASILFAKHGAEVFHVDSSKTSVSWAKKNAQLNGLKEAPIRWIVEDVRKYVRRLDKRGERFDGIILDPPSYGRGGKGEVWKIEKDLIPLLGMLKELLSDRFSFLFLSCHSHGYCPTGLENILLPYSSRAELKSGEMYVKDGAGRRVPSGSFAAMIARK